MDLETFRRMHQHCISSRSIVESLERSGCTNWYAKTTGVIMYMYPGNDTIREASPVCNYQEHGWCSMAQGDPSKEFLDKLFGRKNKQSDVDKNIAEVLESLEV